MLLLERERELGLLDRLVQSTLAGDAVLVLLEGPPGIGKSSLLAKAREKAAAEGFRVLAAKSSDLERHLPYGVVRQLFESLLVDPDRRKRWLSGSAEPAARVFAPPEEDEAMSRGSFGVLHALFWLTANVAADGPLCLSIDDLQWCDRASLRFMAYLERRLEGLRVLVATAARVDDSDTKSTLILDIAHDPAAVAGLVGTPAAAAPDHYAKSDAGMRELRARLMGETRCRRWPAGHTHHGKHANGLHGAGRQP